MSRTRSLAECLALEEKNAVLSRAAARLGAPFHTQGEHRFTAGGCTFYVSAEALEAQPDSYLSMLVLSAMRDAKDGTGAYKVSDITAKDLKALCCFLNTGDLVGPLAKGNVETQELANRFGSEALLKALKSSPVALRAKLDPATIKSLCTYDAGVEKLAYAWAAKLARELPLAKWANGTRVKLTSLSIDNSTAETDFFKAQLPYYHSRCDLDALSDSREAVRALQRWFKASNLPAPKFTLSGIDPSASFLFLTFQTEDNEDSGQTARHRRGGRQYHQ